MDSHPEGCIILMPGIVEHQGIGSLAPDQDGLARRAMGAVAYEIRKALSRDAGNQSPR